MFICFIILIYNFIYFALAYYKIAVRFRTSLKIRFAHDTHVLGNGVGVGYCVGLPNRSKFGGERYIVVVGFIHGHHLRHTPFSVILRLNDSTAKSMSSRFSTTSNLFYG
jgi:hypothetical protein